MIPEKSHIQSPVFIVIITNPKKNIKKTLKMKFAIVLVAVFAVALAAPNANDETLRYDNENIGVDGYKFAWVFIFFLLEI